MRLSLFRGTFGKALALTLVFSLGATLWPTQSYALTGGPSQPEVESFEPIGTTQMVDLYSGDFNYNIPLMTVPGPNGGYPINLAYHAGIGMEQQASWVGLGWNINPGAITRAMRGLPDDFNGDDVVHETYMKPDITAGIGMEGIDIGTSEAAASIGLGELFGFDLGHLTASTYTSLSMSPTIYYNNYRGIGQRMSLSKSTKKTLTHEMASNILSSKSITSGWTVSFDSQKGMGFSPSLSSSSRVGKKAKSFNGSISFNSRQGLVGLSLSKDMTRYASASKVAHTKLTSAIGAGVSFANSTYVPQVNYPMRGISMNLKLQFGEENAGNFNPSVSIPIEYSDNRIPADKRTRSFDAYGYLHTQDASTSNDDRNMFDFNREKDAAISRRTPSMYMPVSTHDVFQIQGQGTGGVFRPFRNDVGRYYDPTTTSNSTAVNLGLEFGAGGGSWKFGVDVGVGYTNSYSGKWKNNVKEIVHMVAQQYASESPLSESYYMKSNGELTAKPLSYMNNIGGTQPISMDLKSVMGDFSPVPRVRKTYHGGGNDTLAAFNDRVIKNQMISYRTKGEIQNTLDYSIPKVGLIYDANQFPWDADSVVLDGITTGENHHIHEVSVLNTDGSRYVYGLPAYNHLHEDYVFAIEGTGGDYTDNPTKSYTPSEDCIIKNGNGQDHFYNKTSMPPYAHSYMLTGVFSNDYVDLTGNGPSTDDLGYYTKFNYVDPYALGDYQWRMPYAANQANYMKGAYSNDQDDKVSFSYGKKDIYYVHSIETKTHIAMFELGNREDGKGASGTHNENGSGHKKLKYLRSITLYSKNDLNTPIKKVHFSYDYSLCQGVPNNDGTAPSGADTDYIESNEDGKLTLKKVFFTYLGNEKGRLSPFEFDYDASNSLRNPDYSERKMDRWGNYQHEHLYDSLFVANSVNPYTFQGTDSTRNDRASAWCLRTISLPSGGDINIEYESDDYGFVQDRRAMQMYEILGFQNVGEGVYVDSAACVNGVTDQIRKNNRRVYFTIPDGRGTVDDILEGLAGERSVYFKTWQRLKREPASIGAGDWAYDYVDGYCELTGESGSISSTIGYFEIEKDRYGTGDIYGIHPFRMAGWQYIRYSRPDLFPPSNEPGGDIASFITVVPNIVSEAIGMITGYYNKAAALGYSKRLQIEGVSDNSEPTQPSYVRLNSPNYLKYGGGCRVSKITMTDNWDEVEGIASSYGQEYVYQNPDGTSSGVADYEPLVGGEENPFRKPVWYNGNEARIALKNEDAFVEEPYGESYFPAANVGYSRVEVRSLKTDPDVTTAHDGVVVNEFYTSKDFPTVVKNGELEHAGFNLPSIIPFIGGISITSNGYSQGYTIELNDMSGKPKMVSTYKYCEDCDFTENPVSQTEYTYHTQPHSSKVLRNDVLVLEADGQVSRKILGMNHDFVMDERQHSTNTFHVGGAANVDGFGPSFVATLLPELELHHSMFRSIGSTKVIYRTGILKEVRNYTDGATIKTNNLLYDEVTGSPLLTSVTNEFKEPVYTYSFPAHWNYEGMNGAWKNLGAQFTLGTYDSGSGGFPIVATNVTEDSLFFPGDVLQIYDSGDSRYEIYYVTDTSSTLVFLEDEDGVDPGSSLSGDSGKIIRSGRRNHLTTNSGTIVSLSNPILNGTTIPEYFKLFNEEASDRAMSYTSFNISGEDDCGTNYTNIVTQRASSWGYDTNLVYEVVHFESGDCVSHMTIEDAEGFDLAASYEFDLLTYGQTATVPYEIGNIEIVNTLASSSEFGERYNCVWIDTVGCFDACPAPILVLHADATEFSDTSWTYNYADVGSPQIRPVGVASEDLDYGNGVNEYRYGQKGIWRASRQSVYLIDRLQTNSGTHKTKVDLDGEYDSFQKFKWDNPDDSFDNDNWEWTTEITRYSPYGFELENRDRLDIYSGEMYGYDNSVVTMVGSNSKYHEMAFDGFEDYTGTSVVGNHGHFEWKEAGGNITLSNAQAHSGEYSVEVPTATTIRHSSTSPNDNNFIMPEAGKSYVATAWIYTGDGGDATLQVYDGTTNTTKSTTASNNITIDGWTRVQVEVDSLDQGMSGVVQVDVINNSGTTIYVDDIRFQPKVGAMKTFVYDPATLWLIAEQDNFGFTTYYHYDEEGTLVQVNQETQRGIITLSTSRQNTKQTP